MSTADAVTSALRVDAAVASLIDRLGETAILRGADAEPYTRDWRGLYKGRPACVARPSSVDEVALTVAVCASHRVSIVPHGGNTGLVGGAVPDGSGEQVVLSLARLNRIRDLDPVDLCVTLEAGVTLQAARDAADRADCTLPLSIASQGSAQIGGIVSTNAGGNHTLRYGNACDLVLGLEVVLADGRIWSGLRRLRKDNTGYRLREIFLGAEGTLGIVTAACLRLVPRVRTTEVAFVAVPTVEAALTLLTRLRTADGETLHAFEYICGGGLELVLSTVERTSRPLDVRADHYVLIELASSRTNAPLREVLESVLAQGLEDGLINDAVLASTVAQQAALWKLREEQSEAQNRAGASIKNDISVPISRTPEFMHRATNACLQILPGVRVLPFGHLGDGNIHFNLVAAANAVGNTILEHGDALAAAVNEVARALGGSFSAEHGIGQLKTGMLAEWRNGVELDIMRKLKEALDPEGLLNPGKVLAR